MIKLLSLKEISYDDCKTSIIVRPLRPADAKQIHLAVQTSLDHLFPFMDWAHDELTKKSQLDRIYLLNKLSKKGVEYHFGVFDHLKNFLVSASLHASKTRNKNCFEIGYWTHVNYRNQGYATLVTQILILIAFEFLCCDRVEICCNKANTSSRKVIEKCGFIFEGEISHYFSKPTDQMLKNGYSTERTALSYRLIPDDLPTLSWYKEIKKHIKFN